MKLEFYRLFFAKGKEKMKSEDLILYREALSGLEGVTDEINAINKELKRRANLTRMSFAGSYQKLRCTFERDPELLTRVEIEDLKDLVKLSIQKAENEEDKETLEALRELQEKIKSYLSQRLETVT